MLLNASIKLCGVSEKGRKELGKEKRKREGKMYTCISFGLHSINSFCHWLQTNWS